MDLASLIGIISGIGLIVSAIILGGEVNNFLNMPGIMIVMGGTMAATLLPRVLTIHTRSPTSKMRSSLSLCACTFASVDRRLRLPLLVLI